MFEFGRQLILLLTRSRKDDRAFVDIRDSSGKIQLVIQELPERLAQARCFDYRKISEALSFVPLESVIAVRGHLEERQFIAKKPVCKIFYLQCVGLTMAIHRILKMAT